MTNMSLQKWPWMSFATNNVIKYVFAGKEKYLGQNSCRSRYRQYTLATNQWRQSLWRRSRKPRVRHWARSSLFPVTVNGFAEFSQPWPSGTSLSHCFCIDSNSLAYRHHVVFGVIKGKVYGRRLRTASRGVYIIWTSTWIIDAWKFPQHQLAGRKSTAAHITFTPGGPSQGVVWRFCDMPSQATFTPCPV